jgi:hypothetical protein
MLAPPGGGPELVEQLAADTTAAPAHVIAVHEMPAVTRMRCLLPMLAPADNVHLPRPGAPAMATIAVLCHRFDRFTERHFMVQELMAHWIAAGHLVQLHEGASEPVRADVAMLHVDSTIVPGEYLEAVSGCPVVVNGATGDIGKRAVSRNLVGPFDGYRGPVIVKTNANAGGVPEWLHATAARKAGVDPGRPAAKHIVGRYPVFPSYDAVPVSLRLDPDLVVERFLPERDPRGYASRHYIFLGDRERCSRLVGPHPVVKGADAFERSLVEVPEAIRARRRELKFDYGKIDFVIHDGEPVLIDANRTPTLPRGAISDAARAGLEVLAGGIEAFLR